MAWDRWDYQVDPPVEGRSNVTVELTADEIELLVEALDSHAYWQLSEPEYRNSGYVLEEGMTDEIRACESLADKLGALSRKEDP